MTFKNGDKVIIARTNSELDNMIVRVVGCAASTPPSGSIYIIESDDELFNVHGELWDTMVLTGACLDMLDSRD